MKKLQSKGAGIYEGGDSIYDNYTRNESRNLKVRVIEMQWRSIGMMKFKVSDNPFDPDNPHYKMVKDTYKAKKGEKIISKPHTEIRKATKIGHDMLLDWGLKGNQIRYEENYSNTTMDFHGVISKNFNGNTLSVVDSLKNIQIFINIVMYHIELSMSRAGGKAIVYDVSQKPKNVPLEDVFFHAKNTGLILINNKAEGHQVNGFNQFQQVDFTLSQSVAQMVNLKAMLEDTADKLTGISASRSGIQKSGDLVGTTERNVIQSTMITAPLFDLHYKLVGDVLQSLTGLMKPAWGKEGRVANFMGDTGMQTMKIDKATCLEEYGMFVENSGKEFKRKENLMGVLNNFSNSGNADPLSIIKAINAETSSEVESILTDGLEAISKSKQALEERTIAAQEGANEIEAKKIEVPLEVARIKSQTEIEVKRMDLEGKAGIQDRDLEHKEDVQHEERVANLDSTMLQSTVENKENT